MKKLNLFTLLLVLALAAFIPAVSKAQSLLPNPGTICLKDPAAENTAEYFSNRASFMFEVYKVSKEDIARIVSSIQKDPAVEIITAGTLTGDYQAFSLILKSAKNKDWFIKTFKNAGLTNIRINRHEVVPVDKM